MRNRSFSSRVFSCFLGVLCDPVAAREKSGKHEKKSQKNQKDQKETASVEIKEWKGPRKDFDLVDGNVRGEWWQGGVLGVVYYTGPNAQKLAEFEKVGRAVAAKLERPYLEIHKEQLQPSDDDANGILVYPDGTARVHLMLMPGGNGGFTLCEVAGVKPGQPIPSRLPRRARGRSRPSAPAWVMSAPAAAARPPRAAFTRRESTTSSWNGACGRGSSSTGAPARASLSRTSSSTGR